MLIRLAPRRELRAPQQPAESVIGLSFVLLSTLRVVLGTDLAKAQRMSRDVAKQTEQVTGSRVEVLTKN